jgi:hypothetical protein
MQWLNVNGQAKGYLLSLNGNMQEEAAVSQRSMPGEIVHQDRRNHREIIGKGYFLIKIQGKTGT